MADPGDTRSSGSPAHRSTVPRGSRWSHTSRTRFCPKTISGLTNDESYTIRVLGYNHNGDGAATEMTATPTATDTTAPTLLLARLDEGQSWVRLIWNETLTVSSVPDVDCVHRERQRRKPRDRPESTFPTATS